MGTLAGCFTSVGKEANFQGLALGAESGGGPHGAEILAVKS